MNLELVQNTIEQIESLDTTFENCQNLAALYIVRDMYKPRKSQLLQYEQVAKELSDIFPQYSKYIEIKKQYQLKKVSADEVSVEIKELCKQIYEFLILLYVDSDMPQERKSLQNLAEKINNEYKKITKM